MKSIVCMVSWFLTAFASIHLAVITYNPAWNILKTLGMGAMEAPVYYAFGIAGVVSMFALAQHASSSCSSCNC